MTRWLVLTLFCTGAGGCAGERPQFGTIMRTDDASGDAGSDQESASSSETRPTTSGSTNTNDASPTSGEQDSSTAGDTPGAADDTSSTGDGRNGSPDSSAPPAMECSIDETEACNDCGQRSCDAENGTWGPCLPVEEPRCNEGETALEVCGSSGNWETQECTNPDPTNCTAACAVPDGVAACVVSAIDADGDGYLSAACEAAPGDDCDDTTQSVSPGSQEVCDTRDNDCDGFVDILDATVSLPGSLARIAGSPTELTRVEVAWHGSEFFFLADGRTSEGSSYTSSVHSGRALGGSTTVTTNEVLAGDLDWGFSSARVASVGNTVGAIVEGRGRASGGRFYTLDSSGAILTSTATSGLYGDITQAGSTFAVVSITPSDPINPFNAVYFGQGLTDGTLGAATVRNDIPGVIENPRLAQGVSVASMVYTESSGAEPSVQLLRWSGENVFGPTRLSEAARSGDVASLAGDAFAFAWATAVGFKVQVRGANGITEICTSEEVAFGNGALDPLDGVAVAESSLGIVVAVADGSAAGHVATFIFDRECSQLTQEGKVLFSSHARPHMPRIAVGGGNIAFAWTMESSGSYWSNLRVMPEAMCE